MAAARAPLLTLLFVVMLLACSMSNVTGSKDSAFVCLEKCEAKCIICSTKCLSRGLKAISCELSCKGKKLTCLAKC
ncbi:hypothetical protein AQUCO_11500017v1 [Aquilegia coerulea]|uniref:Uncharacterized protein n=1 Tax=Aquilegia coerulea TaxID=218851 RepID=A0A2G5C2B4_AQUCA|nr:hypothetical protein AQUCO_11500017v1 [Aquilegia coerulea]